ncbi:SRPBCC domain-containing protein [Actinoplanes sp. NPDC049548]|uniref:SRPBCC family protein n=1 Tax=Actinoplanes sp. NPDC049548 TaxID=3155152 RepID=UPI00342F1E62
MTDEMTYQELDIVRVFDAPRQLVWDAWTDPDQIAAWWGPAGMHTPRESVEMDVRPGGVFRLTMVMDDSGAEFPSDMRFTEVDEPAKLAYEWDAQRGLGAGSTVVTFTDLGDGRTELTNHFAGWITDTVRGFMVQGTNQQLDKLAAYVTR